MARTRSVDFLPDIFQTSTNQQFLAATLDQLVQEPSMKKIQGFVGRRVGPGVNADDRYVAETSAVRQDYQLEPGVTFLKPDTNTVDDAITYPGITDALDLQGAITTRQDRLYTSDYYTWDPFVDFDKFVNFSQYYWLPNGPEVVDVFTGNIPLTDNFVVTRANGSYTFSGVNGTNPNITLVRQGNYTFQVAQNQKETVNFRVQNRNNTAFVIDYEPNPTLTLVRGNTYVFTMNQTGLYPFYIKTQPTLGTTNVYNTGVTNNGAATGTVTFVVPQNAPDTLYYATVLESQMQGQINIVDATPGTGPGFWIQTNPGVNGRLPYAPNISSRDVLGVENNGEDLGTVTFNVPTSTAQDFFYNMTQINNVDLVSTLKFDQINNVFVSQFLVDHPNGIDGITTLNGKTLIFTYQQPDPEAGGWLVNSQFDPLPNAGNVVSGVGSYDTTLYDETTPVPEADRYQVWKIVYKTAVGGGQYITLEPYLVIDNLRKFNITYGTQYSNTTWYKNASGELLQMPLLTAAKNVLYYQDGTDPKIFGAIKLIDQADSGTIEIDEILGQQTYVSPNGVTFTNGLKVRFLGSVNPISYQNKEYYVEGVGTAIKLLPVTNFITPEPYTDPVVADTYIPFDSTLYQPLTSDYLTINRASLDLNPWTRSNRWFHIDVINASAAYNNTVPVLDNQYRGRRPILEFRAGTRLFDFGTEGKQPVDIIDFRVTDAFSAVNGQIGFSTDGYTFVEGTRVIFAADTDPAVRNKIYVVQFIVPDTVAPLIPEPIINLVPAGDAEVLAGQTTVCLNGITQRGLSYWFDGLAWIESQQKISVNQAPLFDVYDTAGISFSDRALYPSSDFRGSKLFSYAPGTGTPDTVLGFALRYLSLSNVGDIVFDNNLYTDTFVYTRNSVSSTTHISDGFVRQYSTRLDYIKEIGWQPAVVKSRNRQQFRFSYDGRPLQMDVAALLDLAVPGLQVYVANQFLESSSYTVTTTNDSTTVTLLGVYAPGDIVEIDVISDQASKVAFYTVPINLANNPLNENSPTFTLGTVRSHYESIGENLKDIVGPINGANNTRDLGNIIPYGTNILQQSSPMTLAGYFMRTQNYNIFNSLSYNSQEYEKFKAQMLDMVITNDYTNYTIPDMLATVIGNMNAGKTSSNPFYWSDMLPANKIFTQSVTTYTPISTPVFDLNTTYDFISSNYKSLLVYVNDVLLTFGIDYTVAVDGPRLTIQKPLVVGDVITINEYATTYGNFVPNTPTKMGLYPAYEPKIYLDTGYTTPTLMIQGHDGSLTVAFGDFRDQLLLEFELRIYNNLKIKSPVPLPAWEVIPGQFRTTQYSIGEINQIQAPDFLSWIGWNKLNYQAQTYSATNQFSWNYSASGSRITATGSTLTEQPFTAGAWRGIYQYFYDTVNPSLTPWEMIGFTVKPDWWESVYGPAPYTSGNLVLWQDLEAGLVADPVAPYFLPQYARPGLTSVIPVGTEGQLLSPFDAVVGLYDSSQFQKSWVFGDSGPVEYSWRRSSSYPFSVMRLLALTRPAEFFSLFADRDLYKYDLDYDQYLYNGRYRLNANDLQLYGNGVSKASYINWIIDYNQQLGFNSSTRLSAELGGLDVRLCYRMGAFTGKQYTKIYTEKSSPNSQNSSLQLPDESYNILLYKNQPFDRTVFSSVIMQIVDGGYSVFGYSINNPYFEILASKTAGPKKQITAGGSTVTVPSTYSDAVVQIPYGYVFTNTTVVADFLLSYGALLSTQGMLFTDQENGHTLDWNQMAQEFLYWANQGWAVGSVINLNPAAYSLTVVRDQAIVDSIRAQTPENLLLDQNRTTLPVRDLVVDRQDNRFTVNSLSQQTISFLDMRYTSYESMVVLDNVSIFNDLIYNPVTGARQSRVYIAATVSADWNGQLDAQGFIENNPVTVQEWEPNRKYAKGEIVKYKNFYWSAQTIVQPSAKFDFANWTRSDYTRIQQGLLQNITNKADQLANSYNTQTANLSTDQDLLSFGLIGFRPRQYMAALNLDDTSQVNLYQQFIGTKGTQESIRLVGNAFLDKGVSEYDVYENWAIQRAVYGANANRSFIELRLNQALLPSDPATVQVIQPQQQSQADQTILLGDVWRESFKLTSTDILPTTLAGPTDVSFPSAGYVNLDDVDITVFSLDAQLSLEPGVLATVGIGTIIWAAKSNNHDWNVYRCNEIPGYIREVSSNLNGTSNVNFTTGHGLSVGDIIIVRFFNTVVDGVHRVLQVPNAITAVIAVDAGNTEAGHGIAFLLQTMRVPQASDIVNLPYSVELIPGAKAWVDNDGTGRWAVFEKTSPFVANGNLPQNSPVEQSKFGYSVAQSQNNIAALIGSPAVASTGAVYAYIKDNLNRYAESDILLLGATDTAGYGNAVDVGNQEWMVAGASASNSDQGYAAVIYRATASNAFDQRQLLVAPDQDFGAGEFGYAVAISQDERWMYIGSPGNNKVYAYGRVDIPLQSVRYITDGDTYIYNYSDVIEIDVAEPEQISVVLNNQALIYGTDFIVTSTNIVLTSTPVRDQLLIIARKTAYQIDTASYFGVEQDATTGSGSGATFTVKNQRGTYDVTITNGGSNYVVSEQLTIDGTNVDVPNSLPTAASGANDITITVTGVDAGAITAFTVSGAGVNNNYIFPLEPYLYTATDIYSFNVKVDGVLQRPHIDYDFNSDSALYNLDLVFNVVPAAGAKIEVTSLSYFTFTQTLTVAGLPAGARFGSSLATATDGRQVMIGAPGDDSATVNTSGSVYAFDRSVINYTITDPTILTYALPANFQEPVAVKLNNQFLTNTAQYLDGDFSVVGTNVVLASTISLAVGDTLELESNIFLEIQKLTADAPFDEAQYGAAVDFCTNNCSLYIGSPYDGTILAQAGSVERRVNQSRVYGTITTTIANPALTDGDTIRINNVEVAVPATPNNTVAGLAVAINNSGIENIQAIASNGYLTISVVNVEAADEFNRLSILPGLTGGAYADLGFDTYAWTQTILSPRTTVGALFGSAVNIDSSANTLLVGAIRGDLIEPEIFDGGRTYFDERSTRFFTPVIQSGVVYEYDYLPSANGSIMNPSMFVFGQQVYDTTMASLDQWGTSINYRDGRLLIGAPGSDLGDSSVNYGRVAIFNNPTRSPAWVITRQQVPTVDVYLLDSVFMYNKLSSSETFFFDFINPLQGKILGAARRNIDYISPADPAKYNTGTINNDGNFWSDIHVGEIWWDVTRTRFLDAEQDDLQYAARRWGQVFPGSSVDIYQWVRSDVPPAQYAGPGTVYSTTSYTVNNRINQRGIIVLEYFFWVTGINTIATNYGKTLSTVGIARYIENPRASGVPFIAGINSSTVAIYNGLQYLSAADTILHIAYDREATEDNVHTEFKLIAAERAGSFLDDNLYRKLQDSFAGVNTTGAKVPDPLLSPPERYGVQFRPRQSMFANRFLALQNYLTYANRILKDYPIVETRSLSLLNSSEPEPSATSGEWNVRVATIQELYWQDIYAVPLGYKYLVASDSTNDGLWTIYTVIQPVVAVAPREFLLSRVQTYDTSKYWQTITWYLPGYNQSQTPVAEVANYSSLATVLTSTAVGQSVKVTANAQNKYEIYLRTELGWDRVALQDGTIEFKPELWDYQIGLFGFDIEVFDAQYFDQEPTIETRKIIQAINEQLFVGDLAIERNRALILMFNFILSEFEAPEWLTKTSLIDVVHKIRELIPYQVYRQDNQTFVLDYLQEVKPYHTQVREFNLLYNGLDAYPGMISDFDNPSYYRRDLDLPQFVSPILLPYTKSTAVGTGTPSDIADTASDAQIWLESPWKEWFNNYLLSIEAVEIINGGTGYTVAPQVIVTGECVEPAEMAAIINSSGQVVAINVVNPGLGYSTTAVITFDGGNGSGAAAYAVMGNQLVRSIKTTIKYDRYQYVSTIYEWQANVTYDAGAQVRYANVVWQANETVSSTTFDPEQWTRVSADSLSGVDRTMGFYTPTPNEPGLELPLLIDGISYPGVQVTAPLFNQNTGFDVGNFDINPFDNIAYGPEGKPTYDPAILDAIYESAYTDPYLGTRPADINVDGGAYVDEYSSHAPEELVPGAEFDTMDFRVYTRQITTYTGDGSDAGPYAAPTASVEVIVAVDNVIVPPSEYTVDYGDSTNSGVTFNTAPDLGAVIVILESDPVSGLEFRIFQDMRGAQAAYRMTPATTTELVQDVSLIDDVIYVVDAAALMEPEPQNNIWGVISINGERIMYRERDTVANTVSSLLRGTAGTAVAEHVSGAVVYNFGRDNLAPAVAQDYVVSQTTLSDGSTTMFSAADIDVTGIPDALLVFVGGIRVTEGYTVTAENPATVEFDTAPPDGVNVTLAVRQAQSWYSPAAPGVALQYQTTTAALFFQGS